MSTLIFYGFLHLRFLSVEPECENSFGIWENMFSKLMKNKERERNASAVDMLEGSKE
jgi:hypothetical protein